MILHKPPAPPTLGTMIKITIAIIIENAAALLLLPLLLLRRKINYAMIYYYSYLISLRGMDMDCKFITIS